MRETSISDINYSPEQVPEKVDDIARYLTRELERIQAALSLLAIRSEKTYNEPDKPRDGDERYADGTSWNPGSGEGKYIYYSAAWHFLG